MLYVILRVTICLSVTTLMAQRTDVFWHGGQVEGYLGQVDRSRS